MQISSTATTVAETQLARRERLRKIVFQTDLGDLWNKTERVAGLSGAFAPLFGGDTNLCTRAAMLSKSDLVSDMVQEFNELQGTMGRYYALNDGEDPAVALALEEQYLPRFATDLLPSSPTGQCLALCDRLDSLVGLFGIGQPPSGSRDPFALRRASLGILRIIIEGQLDLDLRPLVDTVANAHGVLSRSETVVEDVLAYIFERLKAWYQEDGISVECFLSVSARNISRPLDFDRRVRAVSEFSCLNEAASLAAANKRVANILAQQAEQGDIQIDPDALIEEAELALAAAIVSQQRELAPLLSEGHYREALLGLAKLREPIDHFFEDVLVNCADARLRNNRLALLTQLRQLFLEIADISLLTTTR